MIDPYGVTGPRNAANINIRHTEAPSGDLYAVSTKPVIEPDSFIQDIKDNKNREELYAKPQKKTNQMPKTNNVNEEAEVMKSGNSLKVVTPSGDENSSGSKHTEHFEAESGDIYAKVTQSVLQPEK